MSIYTSICIYVCVQYLRRRTKDLSDKLDENDVHFQWGQLARKSVR